MKAYYLPILAIAILYGAATPRTAHAQDEVLTWNTNEKTVSIQTPLNVEKEHVGTNYALRVTPYLANETGDTLRLSPVVFRSARNAKLTKRHRHFREAESANTPELTIGEVYDYSTVVSTLENPWLVSGRTINFGYELQREGCCRETLLGTRTLASSAFKLPPKPRVFIPAFKPVMEPVEEDKGRAGELAKRYPVLQHDSTYIPYTEDRIMSREANMLRVHFPLDKIDLRRDFRGNDTILDQIVLITREILADTRSRVTRIQVIGFASVEGTQKRNTWLGQGRAEALRNYVTAHTNATNALFDINNGKEGWSELRYAIEQSSMEGRDALLNIINTEPDLDKREARMKALDGGRPWAYLKQHILPNQRNSGYVRVFYTFEPDEKARTINRANELFNNGDYQGALAALGDVKDDPRAQNVLGCTLYMNGDVDGALAALDRAAAAGHQGAAENASRIREIRDLQRKAQETDAIIETR